MVVEMVRPRWARAVDVGVGAGDVDDGAREIVDADVEVVERVESLVVGRADAEDRGVEVDVEVVVEVSVAVDVVPELVLDAPLDVVDEEIARVVGSINCAADELLLLLDCECDIVFLSRALFGLSANCANRAPGTTCGEE